MYGTNRNKFVIFSLKNFHVLLRIMEDTTKMPVRNLTCSCWNFKKVDWTLAYDIDEIKSLISCFCDNNSGREIYYRFGYLFLISHNKESGYKEEPNDFGKEKKSVSVLLYYYYYNNIFPFLYSTIWQRFCESIGDLRSPKPTSTIWHIRKGSGCIHWLS